MAAIKGHPGLYWRGSVIWAQWWCKRCPEHPHGSRHRKSTETDLIRKAVDKRIEFIEETKSKKAIIDIEQITVNYLLDRYLNKTDIQRSTLCGYEDLSRKHLRPTLGNHLATDLIYDGRILENFVKAKQSEKWKRGKKGKENIGYSVDRINAMLTLILSAYQHCHIELAGMRPAIPKLDSHSARKTFFTDAEIELLLQHLPEEITRPLRVADITCWRFWSEICSRKRYHWNQDKGILVLEPYESKNQEARIFPLTPELTAILSEQEAVTKSLERKKGKLIPWLFCDPEGNPLVYRYEARDCYKPSRYFRKHWKAALKAAGLVGRRVHDFRRGGIRRFSAMGIDDAIGRLLSGHRTSRIYDEYKAIGQEDLFEAVKKLSGLSDDHNLATKSHKKETKKA